HRGCQAFDAGRAPAEQLFGLHAPLELLLHAKRRSRPFAVDRSPRSGCDGRCHRLDPADSDVAESLSSGSRRWICFEVKPPTMKISISELGRSNISLHRSWITVAQDGGNR